MWLLTLIVYTEFAQNTTPLNVKQSTQYHSNPSSQHVIWKEIVTAALSSFTLTNLLAGLLTLLRLLHSIFASR